MAEETTDDLNAQLPLKGVILCCTALPQDVRTHLADVATQMGAVHKLDLTSDVTHLIVGSVTTPKYRYVAKERPDVKVLHPDWLDAVRTPWLEAADLDVEALERKHRFPVFAGLQVCVTGFDNLDQRNYISDTAAEQGATYHGDLTKTVTHLIAAAPHGDKYTHARKWGIPVVSLKWFEESLRRGMALDESFYDPTLPVEEQGKGAWKRQRTSLGKRRQDGDAQGIAAGDAARKKLRRTASTRLESQSQDMWQEMSAEPVSLRNPDTDQWANEDVRPRTKASDDIPALPAEDSSTTLRSAESFSTSERLFSGCHVLIHGFDEKRSAFLGKTLSDNGAAIVSSASELEEASQQPFFKQRYVLVPHDTTNYPAETKNLPANTITATEWWVERCMHYRRLLDLSDDALSNPLATVRSDTFSDLSISTTGFSGVDFRQIAEAIELIGATHLHKLNDKSDSTGCVLVSGSASPKREKAFWAKKHNIPVVSAQWLYASMLAKRKLPFHGYEISVQDLDASAFTADPAKDNPAGKDGPQQRPREQTDKRKDDERPKRLAFSRKLDATPTLVLQAAKGDAAAKPTLNSQGKGSSRGQHESSAATQGIAPGAQPSTPVRTGSQPLQEVSSNVSPRRNANKSCTSISDAGQDGLEKQSLASADDKRVSTAGLVVEKQSEPEATGIPPAPPTQNKLLADIADLAGLITNSGASRPRSASPAEPPTRRKSRPLGRALSGTSNRSLSASATAADQSVPSRLGAADRDGHDDPGSRTAIDSAPPPGTQLGYETLEAEAHRLQMSKKMGTVLQNDAEMRRLPSLGVVKDAALLADVGVGNRLKGRGRAR